MCRVVLFLCCSLALLALSFAQRRERAQVTFGRTVRSATCGIVMVGTEGTRRRDTKITARVVCDEETLFDAELSLLELEERPLDHGIRLFAETPFGMAYVHIVEDTDADLVESRFERLPEFGSTGMAAPLVLTDANLDITNATFIQNQAGYRSGAMIVSGSSNADLLNVTFSDNAGEEGALHITGSSRTDVDLSLFELNNGTEVGAIKISGESVVSVSECWFRADFGAELANEIYVTDVATGIIDESVIDGEDVKSDFDAFLRDPSRPENDADNFDLPIAAIAAVDQKSTALFSDCFVGGHAGRFGAIYVTDAPIFSALRTTFEGNRGITGGGLFVNSQRAGYARVLECTFTDNVARNGGGLVFAGNGTYVIDECTFENNTALNGGAVWGDYSEGNGCPRGSDGSRITIQASTFAQNTAIQSGGAFFIRCTDIYAEDSVFRENRAMNGDGGFVNAGSTFDLRFSGCSFDQNTASGNGGAIYVDDSHDVVSDDCTWTGNSAGGNGGAIVTINGNELLFKNSQLRKSSSGEDGGGIFGSNLKTINFRATSTERNEAGGRGGVISGSNVSEFRWRNVVAKMNRASSAGAIHIDGGDIFEVKRMQFPKHEATAGDAGAIQLNGVQDITISEVDFLQNSASKACGALSVAKATNVTISNAFLEANVGQKGGAVCLNGAERVRLSSLLFEANIAENGEGGALHIRAPGSVSLNTVVFIKNNASGSGGAVSIADAGDVEITSCVAESNLAKKGDGGAFRLNGGQSLSLKNITLLKNNASGSGGALSIADAGDVEMTSCVAESNLAKKGDGGALFLNKGQSLSLKNTTLLKNNASGSGGALALIDLGSASMVETNVMNSTAPFSGGCLLAENVAKMSLNGSFFSQCVSRNGGAAYFRGFSEVKGNDMIFELNTAEDGGGAFLCRQQTKVDMDKSHFYHNAARDGSTLNADCSCEVDIQNSRIYRDEDQPNNGDFFKINQDCSKLSALGNDFFGGPESNTDVEWYDWLWIIGGAVVAFLLLCFCFCLWRRRRASKKIKKRLNSDIESPANDKDEDEESEEEESDEEEDSEEESEPDSGNESSDGDENDRRRRRRRG